MEGSLEGKGNGKRNGNDKEENNGNGKGKNKGKTAMVRRMSTVEPVLLVKAWRFKLLKGKQGKSLGKGVRSMGRWLMGKLLKNNKHSNHNGGGLSNHHQTESSTHKNHHHHNHTHHHHHHNHLHLAAHTPPSANLGIIHANIAMELAKQYLLTESENRAYMYIRALDVYGESVDRGFRGGGGGQACTGQSNGRKSKKSFRGSRKSKREEGFAKLLPAAAVVPEENEKEKKEEVVNEKKAEVADEEEVVKEKILLKEKRNSVSRVANTETVSRRRSSSGGLFNLVTALSDDTTSTSTPSVVPVRGLTSIPSRRGNLRKANSSMLLDNLRNPSLMTGIGVSRRNLNIVNSSVQQEQAVSMFSHITGEDIAHTHSKHTISEGSFESFVSSENSFSHSIGKQSVRGFFGKSTGGAKQAEIRPKVAGANTGPKRRAPSVNLNAINGKEVSERSERALMKTRILAMNPAEMATDIMATSTTKLTLFHSILLTRFTRFALASLKMRTISLRSAQHQLALDVANDKLAAEKRASGRRMSWKETPDHEVFVAEKEISVERS